MIRGLYSAAGGMQAMSHQQDVIAHNLSHAVKPGYRREVLRFDAIGERTDIVGPATSMHTDFSSGILENTDGKLDVALVDRDFSRSKARVDRCIRGTECSN